MKKKTLRLYDFYKNSFILIIIKNILKIKPFISFYKNDIKECLFYFF